MIKNNIKVAVKYLYNIDKKLFLALKVDPISLLLTVYVGYDFIYSLYIYVFLIIIIHLPIVYLETIYNIKK